MDALLKEFLTEAREQCDHIVESLLILENNPQEKALMDQILRDLHMIKGTCGFFNLEQLRNLIHLCEGQLQAVKASPFIPDGFISLLLKAIDQAQLMMTSIEGQGGKEPEEALDPVILAELSLVKGVKTRVIDSPSKVAEQEVVERSRQASSIRIGIDTLEKLMIEVSELALSRNQLVKLASSLEEGPTANVMKQVSKLTDSLRSQIMQLRMQPVQRLFAALPRLTRGLSLELDKKINLKIEGEKTELDRQLIEMMRDPLIHLIRNCADHGLETPQERRACGKSEVGTIYVKAKHEAGYISIQVSDDGRGLSLEKIKEKLISSNLVKKDELEMMSADDIYAFIFMPGFSTASHVSQISGRGVGMDVVRDRIEAINGHIHFTTQPGEGASFTLQIPLTLAVVPALEMSVAGQVFVTPQYTIQEAIQIESAGEAKLLKMQDRWVLRKGEDVLPVIDLGEIMKLREACEEISAFQTILILKVGLFSFGILVDQVAAIQEIVMKPLPARLSYLPLFSGSTILGDGSVVLILDPARLIQHVGYEVMRPTQSGVPEKMSYIPAKDQARLVLFRLKDQSTQAAVPLSLISRIDSVLQQEIVESKGSKMMSFQGEFMPILAPNGEFPEGEGPFPILIVGVGGEPLGLIASEILDVVDRPWDIEIESDQEGVIGSFALEGRLTHLLNVAYFMQKARPHAFERRHARKFRVLLVDDKSFFRDMLGPIIAAAGYEVYTAASGEEALRQIAKGLSVHALLTDIDMPGMNGYELAGLIKADPENMSLPVLALDAQPSPEVMEAAKSVGMQGVVGKFDRDGLLEWLTQFVDSTAFGARSLEKNISEKATLYSTRGGI